MPPYGEMPFAGSTGVGWAFSLQRSLKPRAPVFIEGRAQGGKASFFHS
jgi:hypothetical protein